MDPRWILNKNNQNIFYGHTKTETSKKNLYFYHEIKIFKNNLIS